MNQSEAQEGALRDYLEVARTRKWTILVVFVLILGGSLALSYRQTPQYVSTNRLLVSGIPSDSSGFAPVPDMGTEAEVVASIEVAKLAKGNLGSEVPPQDLLGGVSVTPVGETQVLSITYTSSDPQLAADAADAFAWSYVVFKRQGARDALIPIVENLQEKRDETLQDLSLIEDQLDAAEKQNDLTRVSFLEQKRSQLESDAQLLSDRVQAALPDRSIALGGGRVLQPATAASTPASPNHRANGIMGGIFGLIFGMAAGFSKDRLDNRFRSRMDAERTLGAPVLATVPRYKTPAQPNPILLSDPRSPASEAYRTLRTNVQFLAAQHGVRSIAVTSPSAAEGKTLTTANLGVALAQAGKRVVIVSADLRRPTIEEYFDAVGRTPGLSEGLQGNIDQLSKVVLRVADNVDLITSGVLPHNPAELLTSSRLEQLIDVLHRRYDVVLFDSVPTLSVADAAILASSTDAAILVIDAGKTHRPAAVRAKEELERVGALLLGSVLNLYDASSSPYYYYGYYPSKTPPPSPDKPGTGEAPSKRRKLLGRRR